jgi:hypothetical protein
VGRLAVHPRRAGTPVPLDPVPGFGQDSRVTNKGAPGNSVGLWVEVKPTEMEVDGGLEMLAVAVAAR